VSRVLGWVARGVGPGTRPAYQTAQNRRQPAGLVHGEACQAGLPASKRGAQSHKRHPGQQLVARHAQRKDTRAKKHTGHRQRGGREGWDQGWGKQVGGGMGWESYG